MSSESFGPVQVAASAASIDPAASGSLDACVAGTGEPGAEQGASPSNTAPYNSNGESARQFKLLRRAVDSLYLSFPGELSEFTEKELGRLKAKAQAENLQGQAMAQFKAGAHIFEVKDKGAGLFPFVLDDNAYRIQLSRRGKRLPMAYVKVSAECLAFKGPQAVQGELVALLESMGSVSGTASVSRIDLASDFVPSCAMDGWPRQAWVTRASKIDSHSADGAFTGWSIGLGGQIGARLYDKVREIVRSRKAWAINLWLPAGWQVGEDVWRLEFELKREFLREHHLSSLDSVLASLGSLWQYATREWLRLTIPSDSDATRARWPVHPLWDALSNVQWEAGDEVRLQRFSNARMPDERRLYGLVYGSLASYMAIHQMDDKNLAIDELLGKMHEHFEAQAIWQGLDADEALARRVRARSRLFNAGLNMDGDESEYAKAYRRATRGE